MAINAEEDMEEYLKGIYTIRHDASFDNLCDTASLKLSRIQGLVALWITLEPEGEQCVHTSLAIMEELAREVEGIISEIQHRNKLSYLYQEAKDGVESMKE